MNHPSLLAIQQSRRAIAVAVLNGSKFEFTQLRHLSSDHGQANDSAIDFIRWILNRFSVNSAALELLPEDDNSRRATVNRLIVSTLRSEAIAIWELTSLELLTAFGHPALKTREKLRSVCASMWPIMRRPEDDLLLDAAAAGLYVQTERLFLT